MVAMAIERQHMAAALDKIRRHIRSLEYTPLTDTEYAEQLQNYREMEHSNNIEGLRHDPFLEAVNDMLLDERVPAGLSHQILLAVIKTRYQTKIEPDER